MIEQRCLIPWDDSISKKSAVTRTATYLVEDVGGLSSVVVENLWSLKKKKNTRLCHSDVIWTVLAIF